jgi:peptidoglycan hydrolase-like protein with peptidoglycan-binding domain
MRAVSATRGRARRLPRATAVVAGLAMALIGALPAEAALAGFAWPTQSVGNRGADVLTIQSLLIGRGYSVPYDGVFTTATRDGVLAFQRARGLVTTGRVEASTWSRLVVTLRPGATGAHVRTLQRQLNAKRSAGLGITGSYGPVTTEAVRALERHVGLPVDGIADTTVWRYLVAHFDLPTFSSSALCDYSVGNAGANWGTAAAIGQLERAGALLVRAGLGRAPVGDIGFEHGGDIPLHSTHEAGLDVDLRPIRNNRDQCTWGTNWQLASYDRAATRVLVRAIRSAAPGHVRLIYFNDPVLIEEGLTTWYAGHDDHLHVRYCEAKHALAAYACPSVTYAGGGRAGGA